MSTIEDVKKEELEELETIRFITGALFEVSAENISRLRSSFEKNRLFYTDISELYHLVKQSALLRGDIKNNETATKVQGISVAFTSNSRFYGSINSDVMETFLEHVRVTKRDCVVIGNTGKVFMSNYPEEKDRVSYFSFEGDRPTVKEMRQFLKTVSEYGQVYVFHPSFVNVFTQNVSVLDITHTPQINENIVGDDIEKIDYIFEPELPKILHFFETRVRYLLFQRAMLESELARTASRLIAMSVAEEKANESLRHVRDELRRGVESFNSMRLLESFSAIKKWRV